MGRLAAVIRFEVRRMATLSRFAWWGALAGFPVAITLLMLQGGPDYNNFANLLYLLAPLAVNMLGLLLWASPTLYSELESNTWPYLAVRPHGKVYVLLGKYLVATVWTCLAALAGLTASIVVMSYSETITDVSSERMFHLWKVLAALSLLAAFSYGALFSLLGVVVHKRPMVITVVYALALEGLIGWIPAIFSELTIQYRLRALFDAWMDWGTSPLLQALDPSLLEPKSPGKQVLILVVATVCLLATAAWLLRRKALVGQDD